MASQKTIQAVDEAISKFEKYRTLECQRVAKFGGPDLISGALLIAMGLRESNLKNVNNPSGTDHGWLQINAPTHPRFLRSVPAVAIHTWGPIVPGRTADEEGFCPRFHEPLDYCLNYLKWGVEIAKDNDASDADAVLVAVEGWNRGLYTALNAWKATGDPNFGSPNPGYSHWVIGRRTLVNSWLNAHPKWKLA